MKKVTDLGSEFDDVLPQPPVITDALLQKNDQEQAALIAKRPGLTTPSRLLRARAVIKDWGEIPVRDLSPKQKEHLADAFALVGLFAKAAALIPNERGYEEYAAAFSNKECDCPPLQGFQLDANERPIAVDFDRKFVKKEFFVNGKRTAIMCCNTCQNLTVRDEYDA